MMLDKLDILKWLSGDETALEAVVVIEKADFVLGEERKSLLIWT